MYVMKPADLHPLKKHTRANAITQKWPMAAPTLAGISARQPVRLAVSASVAKTKEVRAIRPLIVLKAVRVNSKNEKRSLSAGEDFVWSAMNRVSSTAMSTSIHV